MDEVAETVKEAVASSLTLIFDGAVVISTFCAMISFPVTPL